METGGIEPRKGLFPAVSSGPTPNDYGNQRSPPTPTGPRKTDRWGHKPGSQITPATGRTLRTMNETETTTTTTTETVEPTEPTQPTQPVEPAEPDDDRDDDDGRDSDDDK